MVVGSAENVWKKEDAQVFWGEIAPRDHVVQIYENDQAFLDLLTGFVVGGLRSGEAVVVIATATHLASLSERLKAKDLDPLHFQMREKYFPLDAAETLSKFMVNGWPDQEQFTMTIGRVLHRAKKDNSRVRAFGEMVALLWAQGYTGATVQLEHLWNKITAKDPFALFCAYPKSGFTDDPEISMHRICCTHARVVEAGRKSSNEILYKDVDTKLRVA